MSFDIDLNAICEEVKTKVKENYDELSPGSAMLEIIESRSLEICHEVMERYNEMLYQELKKKGVID